jgi:putative hemolysin
VRSFARPYLQRILRLATLNSRYHSMPPEDRAKDFLGEALRVLNITLAFSPGDLSRIPSNGPLVVVANHPFGGLEGLALAWLLRKARPDVKIMANHLLSAIPEMREHIIAVDPFGRSENRNAGPLKQALRWLRAGGLLAVFPAGEVSSFNLRKRAVLDPEWKPAVARLALLGRAPVLPVFFHGANSPMFQVLGLAHSRLRTVLLPRELLNKDGRTLRVSIGSPLPFSKLRTFRDDILATSFLRMHTYVLGKRGRLSAARRQSGKDKPVAGVGDAALLRAEVAALPTERTLTVGGRFAVFVAKGREIPHTLHEIGRLREVSFRQVGEGSGRPLDLDSFDDYYEHLVLWDREAGEVAGAYRLGRADDILETIGPKGLYTYTLFTFQKDFLGRINPALELGRAFVQRKHRKGYAPLLLLWKGIGAYVARNPRYRFLFGPASISDDYSPFSRSLIMEFFAERDGGMGLSGAVRPRNPPRRKNAGCGGLAPAEIRGLCHDVDVLSNLVSEIEADGKGLPVLLRQYLKLGAAVLAFNLDLSFGRAIDGFVVVDLARTPTRTLEKYMGSEAAGLFLDRHACPPLTEEL